MARGVHMHWLCACGGGLGEEPVGVGETWLGAEGGEDFSCRAQRLTGVVWLAEGEQAAAQPEQHLGLLRWHLESFPLLSGVGEQGRGFAMVASAGSARTPGAASDGWWRCRAGMVVSCNGAAAPRGRAAVRCVWGWPCVAWSDEIVVAGRAEPTGKG